MQHHADLLEIRGPDAQVDGLRQSLSEEFPEIKPENILIRENGGTDLVDSAKFKVDRLRELSKKAPWVVFVDDSTDFVHAVLTDGIQNCLVINVPQGKIIPGFKHERLVVINRYPEKYQAMYPFMCAVLTAIDGRSDIDG